jgi:predicted acetyltransferase
MNSSAAYSLLTLQPNAERMDRIVIGVVTLSRLGWQILLTSDYTKILSVDPNYRLPHLATIASTIESALQDCASLAEARAFLNSIPGMVRMDKFEGYFAYASEEDHTAQIAAIFSESVDAPARHAKKNMSSRMASPLRASLRRQFDQLGLLGISQDQIHEHKVIHRYPINEQQGLFADFALKNSRMHVTATVDFTMAEESFTAKKYEAQAKCLVLKASLEICGADTQRYVIVAGGRNKQATAAINLLEANAQIFDFGSSVDMQKYLSIIQTAAHGFAPLH